MYNYLTLLFSDFHKYFAHLDSKLSFMVVFLFEAFVDFQNHVRIVLHFMAVACLIVLLILL